MLIRIFRDDDDDGTIIEVANATVQLKEGVSGLSIGIDHDLAKEVALAMMAMLKANRYQVSEE